MDRKKQDRYNRYITFDNNTIVCVLIHQVIPSLICCNLFTESLMNSDPEKFNFKEYRIRVLNTFEHYYDVIEYRIRHTGKKKASPSSAVYICKRCC